MGKLYERCSLCNGSRVSKMGGTCLGCMAEGYIEIGLTIAQVERLVEAERRRLGDPPAVERALAEAREQCGAKGEPANDSQAQES